MKNYNDFAAKVKCLICDSVKVTLIRKNLRHNIKRNVFKCENCGLVFLEPKRTENYYETEEYRNNYSPVLNQRVDSRELYEITLPFQDDRVELIKSHLSANTALLDVGCASGAFLSATKKHVGEIVGIELNKENAAFVKNELNIKVHSKPIEKIREYNKYFDLITSFQVLEHIGDPISFLQYIKRMLKPDGILCIEVPNLNDSLMSVHKVKEYENFWYREPHVFNYNTESLNYLLNKSGLSGKIFSTQSYSFLNHLHWILNRAPQARIDMGMSEPLLISDGRENNGVVDELNDWFKKVDSEYKSILNRYHIGENLVFIGKIN